MCCTWKKNNLIASWGLGEVNTTIHENNINELSVLAKNQEWLQWKLSTTKEIMLIVTQINTSVVLLQPCSIMPTAEWVRNQLCDLTSYLFKVTRKILFCFWLLITRKFVDFLRNEHLILGRQITKSTCHLFSLIVFDHKADSCSQLPIGVILRGYGNLK